MPAKKKSKPSFKVPEDLESAPQAGWVYRSEKASAAEPEPATKPPAGDPIIQKVAAPPAAISAPTPSTAFDCDTYAEPSSSKTDSSDYSTPGILDYTSKTFSSGMATIGNALMLGAAIIVAPIRVGLWIVGFRNRD
jgi:hypothetical protein